jgi:hypothetical protein
MLHTAITIPLTAPIEAWGKQITELQIHPPKGKDILQCGYPWTSEINPATRGSILSIDVKAMRLLLARTCRVPESTIDELEALDYSQATEAIKFFFRFRIQEKPSTSSSISEDGSATQGLPST